QYATSFCFELPAATHIYTLSLHDALPIYLVDHKQPLVGRRRGAELELCVRDDDAVRPGVAPARLVQREACLLEPLGERTTQRVRSEEHTSELQSRSDLVCRLLLEKKKKKT